MPKPKPPAFTRADLDTLTELASTFCIDHCPFKWLKVPVAVLRPQTSVLNLPLPSPTRPTASDSRFHPRSPPPPSVLCISAPLR